MKLAASLTISLFWLLAFLLPLEAFVSTRTYVKRLDGKGDAFGYDATQH